MHVNVYTKVCNSRIQHEIVWVCGKTFNKTCSPTFGNSSQPSHLFNYCLVIKDDLKLGCYLILNFFISKLILLMDGSTT